MIQPNGARVLIARLPEPQPKSLLIFTPIADDKPSQYAMVLALGTKVREKLAIGDTVILRDYAGARVDPMSTISAEMSDGIENAFIVNEADILMVIGE